MRLLTTAIAFFFLLITCPAQNRVKTMMDSTHMMIGDQLKLHLEVALSPGTELQPLVLKKKEGDVIEFLAQTKWDTLSNEKMLWLKKDLLLTAWDSGFHDVPALPIVFLSNTRQDTIMSRRIEVEVLVPEADSVLADIKPIIEEPILWQDYFAEMAIVGLLLLAALLWFVASRFKTKEETPPPPPIIIPAHERALKKLNDLKEQKLWQQGKVKAFHSQLTYIIREYLENRYGVQALEQTTDEILGQMKNMPFDQSLTPKMTQLLQTADLVKFAKAEPPIDYHDNALTLGEEFVRSTKKVIIVEDKNIQSD